MAVEELDSSESAAQTGMEFWVYIRVNCHSVLELDVGRGGVGQAKECADDVDDVTAARCLISERRC